MIAVGAALGAGALLAPDMTQRVYGTVKVTASQALASARQQVTGEIPTVRLGVSGDVAELDRCDGTFTEMTSYENDSVPEVWAAHNNCGGDVVLPWDVGQRLRLEGSDQVYEVVDIRRTAKTWATTDDLVGLDGELALQTCHYGEDRMKFIGLRPVTGT